MQVIRKAEDFESVINLIQTFRLMNVNIVAFCELLGLNDLSNGRNIEALVQILRAPNRLANSWLTSSFEEAASFSIDEEGFARARRRGALTGFSETSINCKCRAVESSSS